MVKQNRQKELFHCTTKPIIILIRSASNFCFSIFFFFNDTFTQKMFLFLFNTFIEQVVIVLIFFVPLFQTFLAFKHSFLIFFTVVLFFFFFSFSWTSCQNVFELFLLLFLLLTLFNFFWTLSLFTFLWNFYFLYNSTLFFFFFKFYLDLFQTFFSLLTITFPLDRNTLFIFLSLGSDYIIWFGTVQWAKNWVKNLSRASANWKP